MIKIEPPGTWCQYDAIMRTIRRHGGESFVEVGCGAGELSRRLCEKGMQGIGIDFSEEAFHQTRENLQRYIVADRYQLIAGNIFDIGSLSLAVDWGISIMVMEHVEDDLGFIRKIQSFVKPNGHVMIGVPGRRDRWNIEDETVGHLRRYDNNDLKAVLEAAGLLEVRVVSVAVPVANLLFYVGNWLIHNSNEIKKKDLSLEDQTKASGIREISYKTVFPSWCKVLLNQRTLYPLFLLQRLFYNTNLGLTQLGVGRVPP